MIELDSSGASIVHHRRVYDVACPAWKMHFYHMKYLTWQAAPP